jgi:hypothetical protein
MVEKRIRKERERFSLDPVKAMTGVLFSDRKIFHRIFRKTIFFGLYNTKIVLTSLCKSTIISRLTLQGFSQNGEWYAA